MLLENWLTISSGAGNKTMMEERARSTETPLQARRHIPLDTGLKEYSVYINTKEALSDGSGPCSKCTNNQATCMLMPCDLHGQYQNSCSGISKFLCARDE